MGLAIALTGATGFTGHFLVPSLLGVCSSLKILARRAVPGVGDYEIITGALHDQAALAMLVQGCDVVVHNAGATNAINENGYFSVNYAGTKALYEAAVQANVKRFVYVSSLAARLPGISPYAASKRAAEDFLLSQKTKMQIVILRPSAIYGPHDRGTLPLIAGLQNRVAFVPGRASARFSLLHARDFAAVVADAALSPATGVFEIDDLSGGYDWQALADASQTITGLPSRLIYLPHFAVHGVAFGAECFAALRGRASLVNRHKVRELYCQDWVVRGANWPRANPIALAEGLGETIDWYQSQGWLKPGTQKGQIAA